MTILVNEECFEHSFKAKDENEVKVALHVQRIYYPNYLAKRPLFIIGILCARGSGAALICLGPHWQFTESLIFGVNFAIEDRVMIHIIVQFTYFVFSSYTYLVRCWKGELVLSKLGKYPVPQRFIGEPPVSRNWHVTVFETMQSKVRGHLK